MSRIAGRKGRIYLGIASSSATAEPLPFVAKWSIDFGTEKIDVTAMGDDGEVTVGGLPKQTGDWSGFYDDATAQSYTAATDGQARKMYLYPDTTNTAKYFWGTIIPDLKIESDVKGAVEMSAEWAAATPILKVG